MANWEELFAEAERVQDNAYVCYSGMPFGAAVEVASGEIYAGSNNESVAFNPTTHAEQAAISAATSEGEREFTRLAIVCPGDEVLSPCGHCRQILAEHCGSEFPIRSRGGGDIEKWTLGELLPESFASDEVGKK